MATPAVHRRRLAALAALLAALALSPSSQAAPPWSIELFASPLVGLVHRHEAFGFDAGFLARVSSFRATLLAPMRFDRHGLRAVDWDERTDFGRIVGELAWGEPTDAFQVRIAPIAGLSLGVGNLVSRYASTVDPDHWRTGLVASLDFKPAGAVVFMDSVLDPQVAGGRAHVRPFFWVDDRGTFGRLEIGLTLVADAVAPTDATPGPLDGRGLPQSRTGAIVAGGIDLRWPVYRNRWVEVTPYGAWSRLGESNGAHAGLALDFAPRKDVRIGLQGEWRWLQPRFVASYFDGLYMADRHDFGGMPKFRARDLASDARMGGMAGAVVEWRPYLSLGAALDWDAHAAFRAVRADLVVTVPAWMRLAATIQARGIASSADLASPVRRTAAVSADVTIWRSFAAFAAYARDLQAVPAGPSSSRYRPSDTFLAGVRLGAVFEGGRASP